MDRTFHKFLNKMWWVRDRPEVTLVILKQIMTDMLEYVSKKIHDEMSHMNLHPKFRSRRSWSVPNLMSHS